MKPVKVALPTLFALILLAGLSAILVQHTGNVNAKITDEDALLRRIGGNVWAVAHQGDVLYAGIGDRLERIDVSNPAAPVQISQSDELTAPVSSLTLVGGYGLAPAPFAIRTFDLGQPENLDLVNFYDVPSRIINKIVISGTVALVAESKNSGSLTGGGLRLLDVSNPAAPAQLGISYAGDSILDVAVKDGYAYLLMCKTIDPFSCSSEFAIVNIQNPALPVEAAVFSAGSTNLKIAVYGDYLYRLGNGLLEIFDISTPGSLDVVGSKGASGSNIKIIGSKAVFWDSAIRIWDLSDPADPADMGQVSLSRFLPPYGAAGAGNTLFVTSRATGTIAAVELSAAPFVEIGRYASFGNPVDAAQAGDKLLLADAYYSMYVLDNSLPISPTRVFTYDLQLQNPADLTVQGDTAYLFGPGGMEIVDVSNPNEPVFASTYSAGALINDSIIAGDFAYLAINHSANDSLQIVDVSNPAAPALRGSAGMSCHQGKGLALNGRYLYLNESSACSWLPGYLTVIDVADPADPQIVITETIDASLGGMALLNDYLYVVHAADGLQIYDVKSPAAPNQVGAYAYTADPVFEYQQVRLVDGRLYLEVYLQNFTTRRIILDVTDPLSPVEAGDFISFNQLTTTRDGRAYRYVPAGAKGLLIFGGASTGESANTLLYLPFVQR